MRIGLVRHFQVQQPLPSGWRTSQELRDWLHKYNGAACTPCHVDLAQIQWNACLCSDSARTLTTAKALFMGPIEPTHLLREADFAQFPTGNLRLPVLLWIWILRFTWLTGHRSQRQLRDDFRRRMLASADELERRGGDVLVVSHAGMIMHLSAELRRRGFDGPKLRIPQNSKLYLYERPERKS